MPSIIVRSQEERNIRSRLEKFFKLTPWEIVSHKIHGPPKGICQEGSGLFEDAAFDSSDVRFCQHLQKKCGCKEAFLKHLFLVTD